MNSKSKGSNYERQVCKLLSKWIQGTEKPYLFWREALSGGIATIDELNKDMTGDIKPIVPEIMEWWPFSVECKIGYPKTSFWQLWNNSKFGIEEFWKQACYDADRANKLPMLIYRKKGRRQIIGIDKYIQEKLKKKLDRLNHIDIHWNYDIQSCFLYDMIDFFDVVKPDDIRT